MQDWLENAASQDNSRPDCVLLHDELAEQMARAAGTVFDAAIAAQVYNEKEREGAGAP